MDTIDRKRLVNAVELQRKDVTLNFAWGYQLCLSVPSTIIKSFYVNELDVDVSVPVSYRDVGILKKVSEHAARTQGLDIMKSCEGSTLHINPQKIRTASSDSFLKSTAPNLIELINQNLFGFKSASLLQMVEVQLGKLVIVEKGQNISLHSESENKEGTFAIMVLTIPVEGGYKGGRVSVEHEGQVHSFQFETNSEKLFSLVAFHADCKHKLEPVSDGWMMAIVFHVVWVDVAKAADSPLEFPVFFKAFKEIKDEMTHWLNPIVKSESPTGYTPKNKMEVSPKVELVVSSDSGCDLSIPSEKMETDDMEPVSNTDSTVASPMEDTGQPSPSHPEAELILVFPLKEKYANRDLSFSLLRGRDRLVAHLFRSLDFLDVHLAIVSQMVDANLDPLVDWEQTSDWTERAFKITEWFGSSTSLPLSKQIVLDAQSQLFGNINHIHHATKGTDVEADTVIYYHATLVIQPRTQSVLYACRDHLDAVLDMMELKASPFLKVPTKPLPFACKPLIFTLKQVISYCGANPLLAWKSASPETSLMSKRLLELCLALKAKEEGLALLEAMGKEVILDVPKSSSGIPNMFVEGIQNDLVAKTVANFVTHVSDWKTCSSLIMQFITALGTFRQLAYFASLAKYLFENRCLEGAEMVADRISSIVSMLNIVHTNILKDYHIFHFVQLIIILETDPKTSNSSRIDSALALFNRLPIHRQCQLTIDLQTNLDLVFKEYQSCRKIFRHICKILARSDLHSSSCFSELVLPLVKSFIQFGDGDVLRMLIDNICLTPESNGSYLLDFILLSNDSLNIATSSDLGKIAVATLLGAGIKQMISMPLVPKIEVSTDEEMQPEVDIIIEQYKDALGASLLSYLDLVLRMERIPELADSERVSLFGGMLFRLPLEQLIDLILAAQKKDGLIVKEHLATFDLFRSICHLLDLFDKDAMASIPCSKILELAKFFVWMEDEECLLSLSKQIYLGELNNKRSSEDNKILTEIILLEPELLDRLIPEYFNFATITVDALVECWVDKICDLLPPVGSIDVSPPQECLTDQLDVDILNCVLLYFRSENELPHQDSHNVILFSPLLEKMSPLRICHLLVKIYQKNSSLKESIPIFNFWCHICKEFANRNLNDLLKNANDAIVDVMVEVMICLLWLGDHLSLLPFASQICSSHFTLKENPIVSKISSSTKVCEMAETCHYSRMTFCKLLDQRIQRLKMVKARGKLVKQPKESDPERANVCDIQVQLDELRILYRQFQEKTQTTADRTVNHN